MENAFNTFALFFPEKESLFYIFVSTADKSDLSCYSVRLFPLAFKKRSTLDM